MTRVHAELADQIDGPPAEATDSYPAHERDDVVLPRYRLQESKEHRDDELLNELRLELGILDSWPQGDPSDEQFVTFHGLDKKADEYARDRAAETRNPALRCRYLDFVLRRMEPRGRHWIDQCRQTAQAYREYIEHTLTHMTGESDEFAGVWVSDALTRTASIIQSRGMLSNTAQSEWATWIVGVAQRLHDFPWKANERRDLSQRWPFEIVQHLTVLDASNVPDEVRARALALVSEAYDHFRAQPFDDTFTHKVVEIDASLRKHFGQENTHEVMVRRQFEALLERARFHDEEQGTALLVQIHIRKARALAEEHRQYFSDQEIRGLERREREAIGEAVATGAFKQVSGGAVTIDASDLDFTDAAPQSIVADLIGLKEWLPNVANIRSVAEEDMKRFPLQFLFPTAVMSAGKVVGEAFTDEQKLEFEIERRLSLEAQLIGMKTALVLMKAVKDCGLNADHLLEGVSALAVEVDQAPILRRGFECFLEGDDVTAAHVLIPQFEGLLRSLLGRMGVMISEFKRLPDGLSRTDDLSFGKLLRETADDGIQVQALLGEDLWYLIRTVMVSQTGLNLRNKFAHGLARISDCRRENVAVTIYLLLQLVAVPQRAGDARDEEAE